MHERELIYRCFFIRNKLAQEVSSPFMGVSLQQEKRKTMTFSHEPEQYSCPFCALARGESGPLNTPQDIIYQNDIVTAFIPPRWWPNNPGHVISIPNTHVENIYTLPSREAHAIQDLAREVALAFKHVYQCDGVSTRQHNEPAGGQDVWHYHLHVFPR